MVVSWLIQAKVFENYPLEREIKARRVKVLEFKGYNSKIVLVGEAEREEDLKLDQFNLGFRPTVDIALIPLCNTRFTKEHNRAIIYVPGSSHTYIQQNEQYITELYQSYIDCRTKAW